VRRRVVIAGLCLAAAGQATSARADSGAASCLATLDALDVRYERVRRPGIAVGVEVGGPLGGVEYRSFRGDAPLVLDCSLVVSLAVAGRYLAAHGITTATYSSAYQRRNIRGTSRPSRHSFGLAIDVHIFEGDDVGPLTIRDDYEQGLGWEIDCIGRPLTPAGAILRTIDCQLTRSGLFRIILSPDYDADHYNHFHIEALPWQERTDRAELVPRGRS
jgi:hypothetical protein